MPIHPAMAGKFHLLEGVSSIPELFENPALADRRQAFEDYGGFVPPTVATRMDEAPGPHGPVPVRIYAPDSPSGAPCLVWVHGGGFIGGHLDMPEADWVARELVTRWADIAGPEVAAHSQPLKMQWPRPVEGQPQEPATLILRVEGPMALEIQHSSDVILQRVNRFFGWSAVGRLALRQAPLSRRKGPAPSRAPDPKAVAEVAETLSAVEDEELRAALARLGAAIKRN